MIEPGFIEDRVDATLTRYGEKPGEQVSGTAVMIHQATVVRPAKISR